MKYWKKDIDLTDKGKPVGKKVKHTRKQTSGLEAILKTKIPARPWVWK